ncbi:hypothetical protein HALLA_14520 [Halostagnicola larsenii XH-48]|uniref:DUF2240 domain-containing protein n=1 Tax=Halostagnicola larsenii XH-48 TaxID=797299 RepID=W0JS83_9EURY|nr:DUF2240 family protein [Halostagnicola larsenii]AHF99822.1 hypothetical protein HALLA_14520 [Halostagnicola larsenii XH-48]
MSLRVAVAAPFVQNGTERLRENEFVVALSLDRDWFSPDQAKRLIDIATQEDLLAHDGTDLELAFDPATVTIPDDFVPDEDLLAERSAFERVLDALVAEGTEKHEAVGAINTLQQELEITIEAAAVVYARREGIDVSDLAPVARRALTTAGD